MILNGFHDRSMYESTPKNNQERVGADVKVDERKFKSEYYTKRFIGSKYRFPLTFSLIVIDGLMTVGVKISVMHTSSLKEYSAFMPMNVHQDGILKSQNVLHGFCEKFKTNGYSIVNQYIRLGKNVRFEARKSRDSPNSYRFDGSKLIPLEMILLWHYEKETKKPSKRSPRRKVAFMSNMKTILLGEQ